MFSFDEQIKYRKKIVVKPLKYFSAKYHQNLKLLVSKYHI